MEDTAIKHHYPRYNSASKRTPKSYAVFEYSDRGGVKHLAFNDAKMIANPMITFYNIRDCRTYLERLCMQFELCPKYCHLQENVKVCSHFLIQSCKGICKKEEAIEIYNERVDLAIAHSREASQNVIIKRKGRTDNEEAFIMVKNGLYLGYGFIDFDLQISHTEELESHIIKQKDNVDVQRILRKVLLDTKVKKDLVFGVG
jgi:DNA polymerase-3 subunit epsilon